MLCQNAELQSKETEKNRWAVELKQVQQNDIQCAITHDHTYVSSLVFGKGDLLSLEEPSSKVVTYKE